MNQLPKLSSFPSPEDAMEYCDYVIAKYGAASAISEAACLLSNDAYSVLRQRRSGFTACSRLGNASLSSCEHS